MVCGPGSAAGRGLRRNSAERQYASACAQQSCRQRRRRSRPAAKLHIDSTLFGVVQHFLQLRWSPEQIALTLARIHPKSHEHRVLSHEIIYNCIYAQSVSELRREVIACLRHARNKRVPRSKGRDRRGRIPDMLSIHMRPPANRDLVGIFDANP